MRQIPLLTLEARHGRIAGDLLVQQLIDTMLRLRREFVQTRTSASESTVRVVSRGR